MVSQDLDIISNLDETISRAMYFRGFWDIFLEVWVANSKLSFEAFCTLSCQVVDTTIQGFGNWLLVNLVFQCGRPVFGRHLGLLRHLEYHFFQGRVQLVQGFILGFES
ncbi:hypothetical protein TorRG33x02_347780, partial [Trema orientale]